MTRLRLTFNFDMSIFDAKFIRHECLDKKTYYSARNVFPVSNICP